MPKAKTKKPKQKVKVNRLGLTKEEAKKIAKAPIGKKLNFHDFWEKEQRKYRREYQRERMILEHRKFAKEEFVPTVSPLASSLKSKKKNTTTK